MLRQVVQSYVSRIVNNINQNYLAWFAANNYKCRPHLAPLVTAHCTNLLKWKPVHQIQRRVFKPQYHEIAEMWTNSSFVNPLQRNKRNHSQFDLMVIFCT